VADAGQGCLEELDVNRVENDQHDRTPLSYPARIKAAACFKPASSAGKMVSSQLGDGIGWTRRDAFVTAGLIDCPDCGSKLSRSAARCPQCGSTELHGPLRLGRRAPRMIGIEGRNDRTLVVCSLAPAEPATGVRTNTLAPFAPVMFVPVTALLVLTWRMRGYP
jgi:hypothetical protein